MTSILLPSLPWLVRVSLQAAVLALLVAVATRLLRDRLRAGWRFNLWLLVFARLLIPVGMPIHVPLPWHGQTTGSAVRSTTNVPPPPAPIALTVSAPISTGEVHVKSVATKPQPTVIAPASSFSMTLPLAGIWLAGLLTCFARTARGSVRLARQLRDLPAVTDPIVLRELTTAAGAVGLARPPQLLLAPADAVPALVGIWRPAIVMPKSLLSDLRADELRLVLLHELAHVRRRDVLLNCVVALLLAVHWFNPLLWWAAARLRDERELACDELVLAATAGQVAPTDYGQTLLKLVQPLNIAPLRATPAAVGLFERRNGLHRRIAMIARHPDAKPLPRGFALAVVLLLGAAAFTEAAGPQTSPPATPPAASPNTVATPAPTAATAIPPTPTTPTTQQANDALVAQLRASLQSAEVKLAEVSAQAARADQEKRVEDLQKQLADLQAAQEAERKAQQTASLVVDSDTQGNAAVAAVLGRRLSEVNFNANSFSDAIDFLRDVGGTNIFVNWGAIEAVGIGRDAPVTVRVRDVTFATAIDLVLQSVGPNGELAYTVEGGVLRISTAVRARDKVIVQAYDVSALAKTDQEVAAIRQLVIDNVEPSTWKDNGGSLGSISVYKTRLLVTTSSLLQQSVAGVLRSLNDRNAAAATSPQATASLPAPPSPAASVHGVPVPPGMVKDIEKLWSDDYATRIITVNGQTVNAKEIEDAFRAEVTKRVAAYEASHRAGSPSR